MEQQTMGKRIMQLRKEKGYTQEQLAEYIGVTKASVSKWETGQSYPDVTLLPPLAAFFLNKAPPNTTTTRPQARCWPP